MGLSLFFLSYAAGLCYAPFLDLSPALDFLPFGLALCWFIFRSCRWSPVLLPAFFWTLALCLYHLQISPPEDPAHIHSFISSRPLTVEGTVLTLSDRSGGSSVIDMETRLVGSEGIAVPAKGRLRLYLDEPATEIHPGSEIRFIARLRAPNSFGTPGEFDFPRHLAFQGIFATAALTGAREIVSFGTSKGSGFFPIERQRETVARFIDESLDAYRAPLVKALVIGDKGGITSEQRDILARGGISHLFAISGLHLGLIAFFLFSAARFFYRRSESLLLFAPPARFLPVALLPLLLGYLLFSGGALPTRRAFLMGLGGALLLFIRRRTPPLRLLTAVAFLILLVEPLAFFEPSFQLSFAGLLGLLVLLPRWSRRWPTKPRLLKWGISLLSATLAATIATAPFVILHFHLLAPAGLLANLVAVPGIGLAAVPLGLAGVALLPLSPSGASILMETCGLVIQAVVKFVAWLVTLPGLGGWTIYASPHQLAATFLLVLGLLLPDRFLPGRYGRAIFPLLGGFLLLWPLPSPSGLTVTALSVGQGDAILLTRKGGQQILIDGGGLYGDTFDVGERLVAPALGWLDVHTLEAIILTHDHPDHRKRLVYVLKHFPTKAFWSSVPFDQLHPTLKEVLREKNIPVICFPPGWTTLENHGGEGLAIFVPRQMVDSPNDNSLVFYARQGDDGVLLTGDLEKRGVRDLLSATPLPPVSLLKLPHHGNSKSSAEDILDELKPDIAFVSSGRNNSYHLPHATVITALNQRGIPLYRTDFQGTLRFSTQGDGWLARRWQRGLFR